MKKIIFAAVAAASIAAFIPVPAQAWGGLGHKVVIAVAQRHLTEEAKKNIALYMPYNMQKDAVWMDQHRKDKDIAFTTSYHTYNVDGETGTYEASNRYYKGDCVRALYVSDYILRNRKELSDSATLMNIRMIIHWVGDLHCPTHSYLVSDKVQTWPCELNGKPYATFHSVYDKMPQLLYPEQTADEVAELIDDASPRQMKKIAAGSFIDWVPGICELNWLIYEINPAPENLKEVQVLDPDTVEKSRELCNRQMRDAGYRLARLLNEYFGK